MGLRISSVRIQGFRGIPGTITLDMTSRDSAEPLSLVLSGDNGTGKSSIVDAIEFALQGRIARRRDFLRSAIPHAVSVAARETSGVSVLLSDGTTAKREILRLLAVWCGFYHESADAPETVS